MPQGLVFAMSQQHNDVNNQNETTYHRLIMHGRRRRWVFETRMYDRNHDGTKHESSDVKMGPNKASTFFFLYFTNLF